MKFGQYELLERVAVGGMAEVYRGRVAGAEGFEKWVAIKRILPEFARDERFISMMLTEARIHSALSHRNIVQIHDLGISEDGEYFIVLEYVEGHDLRAVMEAASELGVQIPDSLALHVADELAQALHFAHELTDAHGQPLGIIHRDVSPSNVLISNSGEVKLSDFGIAKRRHDHSFVGSLKGNLVYMSPEQARRVPLDRRTDVFSLGAVLFEMLTGHKVRDITDEVSGFRDVASGVVRSARSLRPDLPQAYADLLARALASNPADRFQDAAAFGAAIRELRREHDAPVGPTDMKELIEVLNPPRRARSPVERSKVIRLGPEFKALAGPGRGGRAHGPSDHVTDQPSVILAPGVVPVAAPAGFNGGPTNGARAPGNVTSESVAGHLDQATPPPATPRHREATVPSAASGEATPPPPAPPSSTARWGAAVGLGGGAPSPAQFNAVEAALHALEFSAGNDMQPTPPPPAVLGPFAPEVVTPGPTPRSSGRLPGAQFVNAPAIGHAPANFTATDMDRSAPTPPPRTSTASYPGITGNAHANVHLHVNGTGTIPGLNRAAIPLPSNPLGYRDPSGPIHAAPAAAGGEPLRPQFPLRATGATGTTTAVIPVVRRRGSWIPALLAFLVIVAAAAAVVHYKFIPLGLLAVWNRPATLAISSDPAGATVTLDGRPLPLTTPTQVEVRRDRADHVLEFTHAGTRPVRTTIRFDRTAALGAAVSLPPEPAPPQPPAAPAPEPALPPPPTAAEPVSPPPPAAPTRTNKPSKNTARNAAKLSAKKSAKNSAKKKAAGKKSASKQKGKTKNVNKTGKTKGKTKEGTASSPSTGEL
jgi:serine/threonine-protein kinase